MSAANRRWWTWIIVITLAALAVRVGYILIFRSNPLAGRQLNGHKTLVWGDGMIYTRQANLLADGKGFIVPLPYETKHIVQQAADHPPLYTIYLAAFSFLGLRSDLQHMLVSAIPAALTAVAFALLARRVWSPRAGIIAAVIGAFNPSIIHFPGFILSESLTIPLIATALLWIYRYRDDPGWTNALGAGAFIGIAVLCHPDASMLVPLGIVPVILLMRRVSWRQRIGALAVAGLACGAFVLPWVAFNLHRYEKPVYLSVGLDYSMAQGNCDQTYYGPLIGFFWLYCQSDRIPASLTTQDQSVGAEVIRHNTFAYIDDHLSRLPVVVAARVGRVLGVFRSRQQARLESFVEGREEGLANASVVTYYPIAVGALFGVVLMRRRRRAVYPIIATIVAGLFGSAITLAVLRYRAGAEPALAVLCAIAIDAGIGWIQRAWRDVDGPPDVEAEPVLVNA